MAPFKKKPKGWRPSIDREFSFRKKVKIYNDIVTIDIIVKPSRFQVSIVVDKKVKVKFIKTKSFFAFVDKILEELKEKEPSEVTLVFKNGVVSVKVYENFPSYHMIGKARIVPNISISGLLVRIEDYSEGKKDVRLFNLGNEMNNE